VKLEELRSVETVEVFKDNFLAGSLARTSRGATFTYDENFRNKALEEKSYGLCFSLPPRESVHQVNGTNLHSFFAGLLPEGLRLKALKEILKTSEDDLFSMLLALGSNSIGDVYLKSNTEKDNAKKKAVGFETQDLNKVSFIELFKQSITSADLSSRDLDTGVPGVIPKLSASMISFPVQFSKRNKQYLLKLETEDFPKLAENEHFFMRLAKDCGFEVAKTVVVHDRDNRPGLLVERFDRVYDKPNKTFKRLHQEDACQILDRYPQDKYRLSMREIAEGLVSCCSSPLVDIKKLIELYLFSYVIGNGDLHAKNISVIETASAKAEDGILRIRFSPVYDLLSTIPYGDQKMALKMDAKDDNFRRADFIKFASHFALPEKAVDASIEKIKKKIQPWIARVKDIGLDEKKSLHLQRVMAERIAQVRA